MEISQNVGRLRLKIVAAHQILRVPWRLGGEMVVSTAPSDLHARHQVGFMCHVGFLAKPKLVRFDFRRGVPSRKRRYLSAASIFEACVLWQSWLSSLSTIVAGTML